MDKNNISGGGDFYDKSTYIGYLLKNNKGGIKISGGSIDNNIIKKRDFILNQLEDVINKKRELLYNDLEFYIKALEGKYIRNKMCPSQNQDCQDAMMLVKKTLRKLLIKAMSNFKDLQEDILNIVKTNAPKLYKLYGGKIKKLIKVS